MSKMLIADDTPSLREGLEWSVKGDGREIITCGSAEEAIDLIHRQTFDLVITNMKMADNELAGLEILQAARSKDPLAQVIVITAYGTPELSVNTMRLGAFDYIERGAPGTDVPQMIKAKALLALEFCEAKVRGDG